MELDSRHQPIEQRVIIIGYFDTDMEPSRVIILGYQGEVYYIDTHFIDDVSDAREQSRYIVE